MEYIKELLKQNELILQQTERLLLKEKVIKVEKEECCICYEEYNKKERKKRRMRNCSHICCKECYMNIPKTKRYKTKRYKVCMICRISEKPK
jgi:hypothetical protein